MRAASIERFRENRIGLLAVDSKVTVIVEPERNQDKNIKWMTRKLWRWERKALKGESYGRKPKQ